MPKENQNDNFSAVKCLIYLDPCCKFESVCFQETYLTKFINLDHEGQEGMILKYLVRKYQNVPI